MANHKQNNVNQLLSQVLFGQEANKIEAAWHKWPEPQKSIYGRMLKLDLRLCPKHEHETGKAALRLIDSLENFLMVVDKERN